MSRQKMMETLTSLESLELITKRKTKKDNGENGVNIYEIHCPESMWRVQGENGVVSTVDHVVSTVDQGVVSTADCNNTTLLTRQNNNKPDVKDLKPPASDVQGINAILGAFKKKINPVINFGNKTQRKAAQELIDEFGLEQVLFYIDYLVTVSGNRYAPTITNPLQLKEKYAALIIFAQREENNTKKTSLTVI
jgi:hypothetical protein